jgi:hypothetical protein
MMETRETITTTMTTIPARASLEKKKRAEHMQAAPGKKEGGYDPKDQSAGK